MQISVSGIDRIKERIAKYADLSAKCAELAKRLCEIGEPIIRAAHGGHAVVVAEPTENGYVIRAEGEDILFVEFGAGDATGIMAVVYHLHLPHPFGTVRVVHPAVVCDSLCTVRTGWLFPLHNDVRSRQRYLHADIAHHADRSVG